MLILELLLMIITGSITFIWAGHTQDDLFNSKVIKIVGAGQCPGTNYLPYQVFTQVGTCTMRSAVLTNATIIIRHDLRNKLKLSISINRCGSRENLDSCEEYYRMKNLDFCQGISPDTMVPGASNPFVIPYTPPFKCPIKKGVYHSYNFTFNLIPFAIFNLDGWYWKINITVLSSTENNKLTGCTVLEGYTHL